MDDDDLIVKLELAFAFHPKVERGGPWYRDRALRAGLSDALTRQPLLAQVRVGGSELRRGPLADARQARAILAGGGGDVRELQDRDSSPRTLIRVQPSDTDLVIKIWCGGAALERHRSTLLDQMIATAKDVRSLLEDRAGLLHGFAYPVRDSEGGFDYPRPRPPRVHDTIPIYSVLDFVDLTFHRSGHADASSSGAESLAASELPSFVRRQAHAGLVTIRWVDDAGDVSQLERGATAHEQWLAEHLQTRIDGPYDELGDLYERRGPVEPRAPLTLYSTRTRVGYEAVPVTPEGAVDGVAWRVAREVLRARKLPDGSPVEQVKLVAPNRQLALTLLDQARAEGFAAVLYPADDGAFWDPDPPGRWA